MIRVATLLLLTASASFALDLTVSDDRPAQGAAVLVRARAPAGATLEGTFAGRAVRFWPQGDVNAALLPVDLELEPGAYALEVRARLRAGGTVEAKHTLKVRKGAFRIQRLKVPEKMVHPDPASLARIEREQAEVERTVKQVSPRVFAGSFRRPVPGSETASFGGRRVFNGVPRSPHSGVDFRAGTGTPIASPAHGTVAIVADHYFSGKTVWIDHGMGLYTQYAHLSSTAVRAGQRVKPGDLLGKVGATGRVTGPHLHWGARLSGARVNPLDLTRLPL
jgi:murein DD-endopeptidase MepM/ murein hydrolase activator NlpD